MDFDTVFGGIDDFVQISVNKTPPHKKPPAHRKQPAHRRPPIHKQVLNKQRNPSFSSTLIIAGVVVGVLIFSFISKN